MTIYDIKRLSEADAPHFFDRKTLKFFGQTMRSFRVAKMEDGRYRISAPIINSNLRVGETVRFFNPVNNKLEAI